MKTQNQQQQQHHLKNQDEDGIYLFNQIKDTYSQKIDELSDLKKLVFSSDQLDQQQRSKLRIVIESLLIDLNEEIFSISEELAKSFTFERTRNLLQKAQEFEQRKQQILKKIRDNVDNNQQVKIIRRQAKIQNMSPPQRDLNTFGVQTVESDRVQSHQRNSAIKQQQYSSVSPKQLTLNKHFSAKKTYQEDGNRFDHGGQQNFTLPASTKNGSLRKAKPQVKKSPTPLRRKEQIHQVYGSFQCQDRPHLGSSSSVRQTSNHSAKKQLFTTADQISTNTNNGRVSNETKKLQKNLKKLEDFEKFLERKKAGTQTIQHQDKENKKPNFPKANKRNNDSYLAGSDTTPIETPQNAHHQKSLELKSDAYEAFSQEFMHMKQKVLQLVKQGQDQDQRTRGLEEQMNRLQAENVKQSTDVKILRNEHSEMLHSIYNLEKKNTQLQQENHTLKRILAGERELKGQETNMPRPYVDPNESVMNSTQQNQNNNERKSSPFSSFLQKNRSFSNLRDSKDSSIILPPPPNVFNHNKGPNENIHYSNTLQHPKTRGDTQRLFSANVVNPKPDFVSFYPSLNNQFDNNTSSSQEREQQQQTYQQVRSSLKHLPSSHHNPLLSISNDRVATSIGNQSYIQHQRDGSRVMSGNHSRRHGDGNAFSRMHETPQTPDHLGGGVLATDETPHNNHHNRKDETSLGGGGRQKSFNIINQRMTPSASSNQLIMMGGTSANGDAQLSDWVIERLNKKANQ